MMWLAVIFTAGFGIAAVGYALFRIMQKSALEANGFSGRMS